MHLQLSPEAPTYLRLGATSALVLHVAGGLASLVSGFVALVGPKGGPLHRAAGKVFVASMLIMATVATVVAPFLRQTSNVIRGAFTIYLVVAGWGPVRRPEGAASWFEQTAMVAAFAATCACLGLAWTGAHHAHGLISGVPYQVALIVAGLAGCSAALDLRVVLRHGISGLCFALSRTSASVPTMAERFPDALYRFRPNPHGVLDYPSSLWEGASSAPSFAPLIAAAVNGHIRAA